MKQISLMKSQPHITTLLTVLKRPILKMLPSSHLQPAIQAGLSNVPVLKKHFPSSSNAIFALHMIDNASLTVLMKKQCCPVLLTSSGCSRQTSSLLISVADSLKPNFFLVHTKAFMVFQPPLHDLARDFQAAKAMKEGKRNK